MKKKEPDSELKNAIKKPDGELEVLSDITRTSWGVQW